MKFIWYKRSFTFTFSSFYIKSCMFVNYVYLFW